MEHIRYKKETEVVTFQGKEITLENLSPVFTPEQEAAKRRELEQYQIQERNRSRDFSRKGNHAGKSLPGVHAGAGSGKTPGAGTAALRTFQGKEITLENLSPVFTPEQEAAKRRELEQQLYEVFRKYADKRQSEEAGA